MSQQIARPGLLALLAAITGCSTVDSTSIPSETSPITYVASGSTSGNQDTGNGGTIDYSPGTERGSRGTGPQALPLPASTIEDLDRRATLFDKDRLAVRRSLFGRRLQADRSGIAYFLPRQLAKVTAKRSKIELDKAIKTMGEAELAVSVAKAQVSATKAAIKETEDSLIANGQVPPVRDLLIARLADQRAALVKTEATLATKEQERSAARDAITEAAKQGGTELKEFNVALNVTLMPPTADPRHGYRLSPRHSIFRDDERKVSVSANGLLNSLDIIAADRTGDAMLELATFAGAISRMPGPRTRAFTEQKCAPPEEITAVVDFADRDSVADLNGTLSCMGVRIKTVSGTSSGADLEAPDHAIKTVGGIVYRTPIDVLVRIEKCTAPKGDCTEQDGQWFPTQVLALSLPQAGPISHVPQNAGFMTRTKYTLAFKDGILTNYDSSRPSEVLEVARTPMRLVQGFFDGASKMISIRTGQNNAQAGLSNSEIALLQAENNLLIEALSGRKKLTDEELALLQSRVALRSGQYGSQSQLSSAELAAMQSLLQDQARRDAINRCIGEKVTKGEPIDPCLATP